MSPSSKETQPPQSLQAPVKTRQRNLLLLRRFTAPENIQILIRRFRKDEAAEEPHRGLNRFNEEQRDCWCSN